MERLGPLDQPLELLLGGFEDQHRLAGFLELALPAEDRCRPRQDIGAGGELLLDEPAADLLGLLGIGGSHIDEHHRHGGSFIRLDESG